MADNVVADNVVADNVFDDEPNANDDAVDDDLDLEDSSKVAKIGVHDPKQENVLKSWRKVVIKWQYDFNGSSC